MGGFEVREKDMKKQELTTTVLKSIIQDLHQIVMQSHIKSTIINKSILFPYPIASTLRTQLNWSLYKQLFNIEYKLTINNIISEFRNINELT